MLSLILTALIPAAQSFDCVPTAIYDGDTLWCRTHKARVVVRLAGIDAREMDGSCSSGHPCPSADPVAARDHLVRLVGTPTGKLSTGHITVKGPTMRCRSVGGGKGARTAAWCVSPKGGDLSCAMVRDGYAARWDRYWQGHRC